MNDSRIKWACIIAIGLLLTAIMIILFIPDLGCDDFTKAEYDKGDIPVRCTEKS